MSRASFSLLIHIENDAFVPDPAPEVVRIMREAAEQIERYGLSAFDKVLRDINGNQVGWITLAPARV